MKQASSLRVSSRVNVILCLLLGVIFCLKVSLGHAALIIDSQSGQVGDTVTFTIHIQAAQNVVNALGFDILYDRNVLEYTGSFSRGDVVDGFNFFSVNEPRPGRTRVAGFTVGEGIAAGRSGVMVTLEFRVAAPGSASLTIVRQVDDVNGWSTQAGVFDGMTATEPSETVASESPPEQATEDASQIATGVTDESASQQSTESTEAMVAESSSDAQTARSISSTSKPSNLTTPPTASVQTGGGPIVISRSFTTSKETDARAPGVTVATTPTRRETATSSVTEEGLSSPRQETDATGSSDSGIVTQQTRLLEETSEPFRPGGADTPQQTVSRMAVQRQDASRPAHEAEHRVTPQTVPRARAFGVGEATGTARPVGILTPTTRLLVFGLLAVLLCVVVAAIIGPSVSQRRK